ncbi:hypothetical protein VD0002_g6956 [Verticillium dahliae]|nr:hypothetical protein VD0002_g6956 [Verticillium dahliae]
MAATLSAAPVLSTPAEHMFEDPTPDTTSPETEPIHARTDEELLSLYEIRRTAREIKQGGWKRIALQFADHMLRDAGWVVEALHKAIAEEIAPAKEAEQEAPAASGAATETDLTTTTSAQTSQTERIYILADTSYSACCVDEIAAEPADAQVVVHYGRSCLSPTSRLPVIYVFTHHALDHDAVASQFEATFPDKAAKVILMADITYQDHVLDVANLLRTRGYTNLVHTTVVHDPAGTIPNRRIATADDTSSTAEHSPPFETELDLPSHALFHISTPPPALLLALQTRLASLHVLSTATATPTTDDPTVHTAALLRRRFARVLTLASASIVGILVNTLSLDGSLRSLDLLRARIAAAGKKSYTIVVGKLNPAKLANFAEVDGWVVVGCWESGLVEEDAGFYRPVITPFEMEVALLPPEERIWGLEWWAGIEKLKPEEEVRAPASGDEAIAAEDDTEEVEGGVEGEESAPPEYDLRTGRLVASRPMKVAVGGHLKPRADGPAETDAAGATLDRPSEALVKRQAGDLATINGVLSPGAEFLRSQRTWQGLGTDHDPAEESTAIEEGRSGVARGYTVGDDASRA